MSETAVLLCGHGSRDPEAIARVRAWRPRHCARGSPEFDFATGYLEFARPTIRDGLAAVGGARRAADLGGAGHAVRREPRQERPAVGDEQLHGRQSRRRGPARPRSRRSTRSCSHAAADRIAARRPTANRARRDACSSWSAAAPTTPTPIPTSPRSRACCGKAWGSAGPRAAFSGVAHPRVDAALDAGRRLGFRRIVVFPYFLFTGVLVKRIYAQTDAVAARFPEIEFVKARYLRDHRRGARRFRRPRRRARRRPAGDELPALQVPHADHRLRR